MNAPRSPERHRGTIVHSHRVTRSKAVVRERLRLLREAVGGPAAVRGKLRRIGRTAAIRLDRHELGRRLERLRDVGLVASIPTRRQLAVAASDMLRFSILPAAREYYRLKQIPFRFHYLLRFVEDPVSMLDPVGLYSDRDAIIGHLLQSVHLNPVYDLELLQMFDDGLAALEQQAQAIVDGRHPRQATIATTVEDPDYHGRLLAFVRAYRADRDAPPPLRDAGTLRDDPEFRRAEAQFHTLPAFTRYAARLPRSWTGLLRHRLTTTRLDPRYCDPPAEVTPPRDRSAR